MLLRQTIRPNEIFLIVSLVMLTIEIRQYNQFYLMETNRLKQCSFQALCNCIITNYSTSMTSMTTSRHYARDETINFQQNKQLMLFDCKSIPIYKFPDIPYGRIDRLVIHGSEIANLEFESLSSFQIQSLILSHNRIQTIYSKSFSSSETTLVQLDLSHNQLQSIPFGALLNLKNLNFLNLDSNEIQSIFGNWPQFHNTLRSLSLAGNEIQQIQKLSLSSSTSSSSSAIEIQDFRELEHLQWLNLDSNQIRELTAHILPENLQTLSLAHNHLEHFPFGLFHLRHLKWLIFKDNFLNGFNHEFRSILKTQIWIEKLDLAENFIDRFPNVTVQQTNSILTNPLIVRDLNLSYNEITEIRNNDFRFLKCDRLLLGHNQITKFANDSLIELAKTLTYLDLDHNQLKEIPKSFQYLKTLKYLYLSSNQLGNVKNSIELLPGGGSLKVLSLSNNFLRSIPNCANLTYLNLGYNEIYRLSGTTSGCFQLKTLLLHNNRLIELRRDQFVKFPNLQELNLSFNPIRVIETTIFANLTALKSLEMSFIELLDENNSGFFRNLRSIKWLLLDNNGFREIPETIADLKHLQYLNFEWNRLIRLPTFRLMTDLKDLRLSYNFVNELTASEFDQLVNLRAIFLNGNRLVELKRGTFHGLVRLQLILLCDNLLRQFDKLVFYDLPHLKLLSLQRNRLTSFSFETFHNVSTSTLDGNGLILNLSRNSISQCPYSVQNPIDLTVNIAKIDFSHNRFREWPTCLSFLRFSLIELRLQSNEIESLDFNDKSSTQKFISLQQIDFGWNRIVTIDRDFFHNFPHLQMVDLSGNQLKLLHTQQFQLNGHLKWLNLSRNSLGAIPKDCFSFSKFEMIDLSSNRLNAIPKSAINVISLKSLNLGRNFIDFLDSTMLWKLLNLETLNLCDNRMTVLADNVFSNMAKLRHLNVNGNLIRANFKELFHYAHDLYELDFARNNLTTLPLLPLPNLIKLNLAYNQIADVSPGSIEMLVKLKYLVLSYNRLKIVPKHIWQHFPNLKFLDLSGNYFKDFSSDSFQNLNRLTTLHLTDMNYVQYFANDVFYSLSNSLKTIRIGIFANYYRQINQNKWCHMFLKPLKYVRELEIDENNPKIRQLHLTRHLFDCLDDQQQRKKITKITFHGNSIAKIERDLLEKFANNVRLEIEITHTEINELPVGLFSQLNRIGRLRIILRHNRLLTFLSPETFYFNASSWEKIGTKLLSDGLILENQNWQCGCHLAWLSHWYRRWIHESLQLYNQSPENVLETYESLMQITCLNLAKNTITNSDDEDDDGNQDHRMPIINLLPDEMQCQASALNFTNSIFSSITNRNRAIFYSFLLIFLILFL